MLAVLLGVIVLLAGACAMLWQRAARATAAAVGDDAPLDLRREHFALAHRFTNDAVLLLDAQGRILDANDRAVELYGRPAQELGSLTFSALRTTTGDLEDDARDDLLVARVQEALVFEAEHRHRDGHALPVEVSARRFELDGQAYVQCFVRDISDRSRAEQALRESERRFR